TSRIGLSGHFACAGTAGASATITAGSKAENIFLIVILPQIFTSFLLIGRNHKARRDCPPAGASAPALRGHIAAPDRRGRPHRLRGSRSDAESPCPTRRVSAPPPSRRGQSAPPPHKAAWKCVRRRT